MVILVLIRCAFLEGKLLSSLEKAYEGGDPEFTACPGSLRNPGEIKDGYGGAS